MPESDKPKEKKEAPRSQEGKPRYKPRSLPDYIRLV